jgi:hypothetical protein
VQTKLRPGFAQERHEGVTDDDELHDVSASKTVEGDATHPSDMLTVHGTPRQPINQGAELLLTAEVHAGVMYTCVDDKGGYLVLSHEDISVSLRDLDVSVPVLRPFLLSSPLLSSPVLTSPHLSSPHLTSPHLA